MDIGDRVETTCEYEKMFKNEDDFKPFKGIVVEIIKQRDNTVIVVEKSCGCTKSIGKGWLRKSPRKWLKRRCCCHCHCHCSCHCCCH